LKTRFVGTRYKHAKVGQVTVAELIQKLSAYAPNAVVLKGEYMTDPDSDGTSYVKQTKILRVHGIEMDAEDYDLWIESEHPEDVVFVYLE
jgi:hypothetical protein